MDLFAPELLNSLMYEAERDARAVLDTLSDTPDGGIVDTSAFIPASADARQDLELDRRGRFALMFETLTDKYDNALRTDALLRDVAAGRQGFVLFLRGFSLKEMAFPDPSAEEVSLLQIEKLPMDMRPFHEQDLDEYEARFELAMSLAPIPVVMVRNPATSESLIHQFPGAAKAVENTFAIDLDHSWEGEVENLVRAASYVVVRNKVPGPGLDAEIAMVRRFERLGDTFFTHPVNVATDTGGTTAQPLNDHAIARMRGARPQTAPGGFELPSPPTCLWVQGDRRRRIAENVFFIFDFLNSLADRGQPMPRDMQGRLLFSAVAGSIGLERLDLLIMTLSSYANVVSQYRPDELPDPGPILKNYGEILGAVAQAIDAGHDAEAVLEFRDLPRLRTLMGGGEDAKQLIRATMGVLQRMQMRLRLSPDSRQ